MLTRRHVVTVLGALAMQPAATGRSPAQSALRIQPVLQDPASILLAVIPFTGGQADGGLASGLSQIISDDLNGSRLIQSVASAASFERVIDFDSPPRPERLRALHADAMVVGRAIRHDDGRVEVAFRLYDVASGHQRIGQRYVAPPDHWRRIAHIISDQIYGCLVGDSKGYFDSRVAYIEGEGAGHRPGRLALMDRDGANMRYLTAGAAAMRPRFSSAGHEICYVDTDGGAPRLLLLNIASGQGEILGKLPGLVKSAPSFAPDDKRIAIGIEQGDHGNLFAVDLDTKSITRLTDTPAIDTSPCYSPDGSQICFESDRGGKPQIYVMSANGGNAQRITFGEGSYSTPVWSPRGDTIAFTKQGGGQFAIGIMKTDGSGERILASGFHNEGPTFSPNGRVLMFFRDLGGTGGPSLFSIDVSGRNELKVPTPGYASDPAWSPLLS
ncbi:protein TolB [Bradyrhizobium sp. SSBR45G]|nr:protein TolB [Bradyrhizobium sp. SSBR45G]